MKREIKFRYWNGVTNQMVNDPQMPYKDGWSITELFSDRGWEWLQYTGLKDKDGKEIYEGDVVDVIWLPEYAEYEDDYTTRRGYISYHSDQLAWHLDCGSVSIPLIGLIDKEADIEILGNLYENSELLDG